MNWITFSYVAYYASRNRIGINPAAIFNPMFGWETKCISLNDETWLVQKYLEGPGSGVCIEEPVQQVPVSSIMYWRVRNGQLTSSNRNPCVLHTNSHHSRLEAVDNLLRH